MTERPEPDLVTVAEVAARVGAAVQTVRTWIRRGFFPVVVRDTHGPGRRIWVRWADVRALGERQAIGKERPAWLDEPDPPLPA